MRSWRRLSNGGSADVSLNDLRAVPDQSTVEHQRWQDAVAREPLHRMRANAEAFSDFGPAEQTDNNLFGPWGEGGAGLV